MNHLDGKSMDILQHNIERLKELFPEIVTEGKVNFDALRQVLGDVVEEEKEAYSFTWTGKKQALRLSQTPSTGTLRPAKVESKNWDTTQNLYIEGDNLEVLKLLQKSYFGRVKMIYIDPPYNTGKDFIYKDNFHNNIRKYKEITGQIDGEGKSLSTSSESDGRFHRDWLNMVFPRLRLARNLLSEDGVIFISIDNSEHENLKKICDEVLGVSNFISNLCIENNPKGRKNNAFFAESFDYCLVYAKNIQHIYSLINKSGTKKYFMGIQNSTIDNRNVYHDEFGEFRQSKRQVVGVNKSNALASKSNPTRCFTIYYDGLSNDLVVLDEYNVIEDSWFLSQAGKELLNKGYKRYVGTNSITRKPSIPLYSKATILNMFIENRLFFKDDGTIYEKDREDTQQLTSLLANKKFGLDIMTESATAKMEQLFQKKDVFQNSKAIDLIKALVVQIPYNDEIILDFFSGSATTAHAVMQLNAEDGGNRKYIMVQLPEPTDEKSVAYKAGFKNICEIGKERIRRAGEAVKQQALEAWNKADFEQRQQMKDPEELDIGFKVFKLDDTNLVKWNPDREKLEDSLLGYVDNLEPGRSQEDLLYEVMLKMGIDLTWPIEEHRIGNQTIYSVGLGALMVCLGSGITTQVAEEMVRLKERLQPETWKVVFKDSGFADDMAKTNTRETLKMAGLAEDAFTTL